MPGANHVAIVAESQEFFGAGLSAMLKRRLGFSKVMEARSAEQLMQTLEQSPGISLVTVDLGLPQLSGVSGLQTIRQHFPRTKLIVIAESSDREVILGALFAGVHGYIVKSTPAKDIVEGLRSVLKGQVLVPATIAEEASAMTAWPFAPEPPVARDFDELTARQREILMLVSLGKSTKEVARLLSIAPGTVKAHINAAYRTLGVHNRVTASAAIRLSSRTPPRAMLNVRA